MSLEENKAIVRKMVKAFNKQDLAVLDELIALDYVDHTNQIRGREKVKQFYTMVFKDFPDFHRAIEDIIAGGDKVWARFKTTGTAPSGKKMELTSITIFRIVNGKAAEGWGGIIRKMSIPKVTGELHEKLL